MAPSSPTRSRVTYAHHCDPEESGASYPHLHKLCTLVYQLILSKIPEPDSEESERLPAWLAEEAQNGQVGCKDATVTISAMLNLQPRPERF